MDGSHWQVHAIGNPDTIGERYAANAGALYMADMAKTLADAYPDRKIKTRTAPNFLIKLAGRFDKTAAQAAHNLGRNLDVDGSKAERDMGFTYIPTEDALRASAEFLVGAGK